LNEIFTSQEERRLTGSLTLHYRRVMYVVDPACDAAKLARGKRVLVRENEAGDVVIEYRGIRLPAQAFPKERARISSGAIVGNKLLGSTPTASSSAACNDPNLAVTVPIGQSLSGANLAKLYGIARPVLTQAQLIQGCLPIVTARALTP
jgi:hypothetical protein